MRVAFFGATPTGLRCLRHLAETPDAEIVAVCGGRRSGRGWWGVADVAGLARKLGLAVISRPADVVGMGPDLILSIYFDRILSQEVLDSAPLGAVNLHPGPLPEYRGRNGVLHAILNGEREYGAALHYMDAGVDTGPIIECQRFPFPGDATARELYDQTVEVACELLTRRLPDLLAGPVEARPQGAGKHVYRSADVPDGEVDWSWSPEYIDRYLRAMTFPPFERPWIRVGRRKAHIVIEDARRDAADTIARDTECGGSSPLPGDRPRRAG